MVVICQLNGVCCMVLTSFVGFKKCALCRPCQAGYVGFYSSRQVKGSKTLRISIVKEGKTP